MILSLRWVCVLCFRMLTAVDLVLLCVILLHLVTCPYTKVEESFNIQATHDILYHGTDLSKYDHLEFPGVVPRSFLGPLYISLVSWPAVYSAMWAGCDKMAAQYIVRLVLGLTVLCCFICYQRAVSAKLGRGVGRWLQLISASQFHLIFYMSRPLPNTFALAIALLAMSHWLRQNHGGFIWTSGLGVIVFRTELALLLAPMLLSDLWNRRLGLIKCIAHVFIAGIFFLRLTVGVDSVFWGRTLWPEGEVFWYNTVLNKSSHWGPFLWYFYSALPRALLSSLLLLPLSLLSDRRSWYLLTPATIFVFLFSFLPHKELRFIIYTFPLFNTAAALVANRLWQNKHKSCLRFILALGVLSHLFVNLSVTSGSLYISSLNYPGGEAMKQLHEIVPPETKVHVHIDVYSAQSGVTRFTQLHPHWIYNKTEDLSVSDLLSFSHLLIGVHEGDPVEYMTSHQVLTTVSGYSGLQFKHRDYPPLEIKTEPKIVLLEKISQLKDDVIS